MRWVHLIIIQLKKPILTRRFGSRSVLQSPIYSADFEAICAICVPIQIEHVHFSVSYQQVTYQKYHRHGHELPSGYSLKGPAICCNTARPSKGPAMHTNPMLCKQCISNMLKNWLRWSLMLLEADNCRKMAHFIASCGRALSWHRKEFLLLSIVISCHN